MKKTSLEKKINGYLELVINTKNRDAANSNVSIASIGYLDFIKQTQLTIPPIYFSYSFHAFPKHLVQFPLLFL